MCTDLRAKILKTAGELFFKFGIRSVSIDDICNELHISKKTFYTVFKQKDELVVELLDAMSQKKEKDYLLFRKKHKNDVYDLYLYISDIASEGFVDDLPSLFNNVKSLPLIIINPITVSNIN